MYFSKYHRNLLKQENTELSFGDLGKTVGAMWKSASADEKQPFEEQAATDKVRFLKQASTYKKPIGPTPEKTEEEAAKKPKSNEVDDDESESSDDEYEEEPEMDDIEGRTLDAHLQDEETSAILEAASSS
jgi:hypothetical protein